MNGWDVDALQRVLDNCDNGSEIPVGTEFCEEWLTHKVPVFDDEPGPFEKLKAPGVQPPQVDTQATICAEQVD